MLLISNWRAEPLVNGLPYDVQQLYDSGHRACHYDQGWGSHGTVCISCSCSDLEQNACKLPCPQPPWPRIYHTLRQQRAFSCPQSPSWASWQGCQQRSRPCQDRSGGSCSRPGLKKSTNILTAETHLIHGICQGPIMIPDHAREGEASKKNFISIKKKTYAQRIKKKRFKHQKKTFVLNLVGARTQGKHQKKTLCR